MPTIEATSQHEYAYLDPDGITEQYHSELPAYSKEDPNKQPPKFVSTTAASDDYLAHEPPRSTFRPSSVSPRRDRGRPNRITNKISDRNPKRKLCTVLLVVFIIAAIIIGSVVGVLKRKKPVSPQKYRQRQYFVGNDFFHNFDYYTNTSDESFTNSFVNETEAARLNLTSVGRYDNVSLSMQNQTSVRIVSKDSFSAGLYLFNIHDIPLGCDRIPTIRLSSTGHYPAPNDITIFQTRGLEGRGYFGLHTTGDCKISAMTEYGSSMSNAICQNRTSGAEQCRLYLWDIGRDVVMQQTIAVELSSKGLKMWTKWWNMKGEQFLDDTVDISTWGDPDIFFPSSDCDMLSNFGDLHLVADIATCGNYGYYSRSYQWYSGDWCETSCKSLSAAQNETYETHPAWDWGGWRVLIPVD